MVDPDDAQVKLDKAEEGGLMAYPDILGKRVTVQAVPTYADAIATLVQGTRRGTCVKVGPLGFALEWRERVEVRRVGGAVERDDVVTYREFIPWSAACVRWEHASEPYESEQVQE